MSSVLEQLTAHRNALAASLHDAEALLAMLGASAPTPAAGGNGAVGGRHFTGRQAWRNDPVRVAAWERKMRKVWKLRHARRSTAAPTNNLTTEGV